jgi:FAD/FMN-containing dehydrogenase
MGFGRNDGALVINLSYMKVMEYNEETGILTYGGPVTISDCANFLWHGYNRALPHGRCPDVGMTGVAASGFGTLSRASGTVLDNIAGARVAVANGSIFDVSPTLNSDLYWGIRGAASSLGVVLQFELRTLQPPSQVVTNYTIAFKDDYDPTQQDNVDALLGIQKWALSADNNDLVSIRHGLRKSSELKGMFYGTSLQFANISASIMTNLPSAMVLTTTEADFWTSEDYATPGIIEQTITPRRYFYITAVTIPESSPLTNATAWQLYSSTVYSPELPNATASGFVDVWGGAYTKSIDADASAWKHGNELLLVRWDLRTKSYDIAWPDDTIERMRAGFYEFVDEYEAGGGEVGGFVTYRDEKWDVEETAKYLYGENYERLQRVKTEYDPGEMFNTDPQAVPALKS